MNKIIPVALAAIVLASCGSSGSADVVSADSAETTEVVQETEQPVETTTTSTTTTTEAPTPSTRPTLPPEPEEPAMNGYQPDVYIDILRDNVPYWYYNYSDENLINIGIAVCEELDAGVPVDRQLMDLYVTAIDVDYDLGDDVGFVMRYIVRYICPEHFDQIEALAADI